MSTLDQLQGRVEDALHALVSMQRTGALPPILQPLLAIAPPPGMEAVVRLQPLDHDDGRGRRGWDPRSGRVLLSFAPRREVEDGGGDAGGDPIADLIAVVAEAERNPLLSFVALKFLRDRLLPQTARAWTRSPQTCQRAIGDAIERGLLWTSKKPNPRNPEFPVTAVHLNRESPAVQEVLARLPAGAAATAPPAAGEGERDLDGHEPL